MMNEEEERTVNNLDNVSSAKDTSKTDANNLENVDCDLDEKNLWKTDDIFDQSKETKEKQNEEIKSSTTGSIPFVEGDVLQQNNTKPQDAFSNLSNRSSVPIEIPPEKLLSTKIDVSCKSYFKPPSIVVYTLTKTTQNLKDDSILKDLKMTEDFTESINEVSTSKLSLESMTETQSNEGKTIIIEIPSFDSNDELVSDSIKEETTQESFLMTSSQANFEFNEITSNDGMLTEDGSYTSRQDGGLSVEASQESIRNTQSIEPIKESELEMPSYEDFQLNQESIEEVSPFVQAQISQTESLLNVQSDELTMEASSSEPIHQTSSVEESQSLVREESLNQYIQETIMDVPMRESEKEMPSFEENRTTLIEEFLEEQSQEPLNDSTETFSSGFNQESASEDLDQESTHEDEAAKESVQEIESVEENEKTNESMQQNEPANESIQSNELSKETIQQNELSNESIQENELSKESIQENEPIEESKQEIVTEVASSHSNDVARGSSSNEPNPKPLPAQNSINLETDQQQSQAPPSYTSLELAYDSSDSNAEKNSSSLETEDLSGSNGVINVESCDTAELDDGHSSLIQIASMRSVEENESVNIVVDEQFSMCKSNCQPENATDLFERKLSKNASSNVTSNDEVSLSDGVVKSKKRPRSKQSKKLKQSGKESEAGQRPPPRKTLRYSKDEKYHQDGYTLEYVKKLTMNQNNISSSATTSHQK